MTASGNLRGIARVFALGAGLLAVTGMSACAGGGGASARGRASGATRAVQVDAVALRVVGGKIAQDTLASMGASSDRGALAVDSGSTEALLAKLRQVADVQVLGNPSVIVTPGNARTVRVGAAAGPEISEMGFLSGVTTDVRLCFESAPSSARGGYGLKISGSVLQFTPDKPGGGASNAAYTRLRDFESDVTLRAGQPALVSGPALVEQADGIWTGVVIVLTPREPTAAALASVNADE